MLKRTLPVLLIAIILSQPSGLSPAGSFDISRLRGAWRLMYQRDYGYTFRFLANYQAVCIIHMNTGAAVFKGIYSSESENSIRINIYEMKNDCNARSPSLSGGFTKTSATYFVFRATFSGKPEAPVLVLSPEHTVIDGRSSEGYFEPKIHLNRSR